MAQLKGKNVKRKVAAKTAPEKKLKNQHENATQHEGSEDIVNANTGDINYDGELELNKIFEKLGDNSHIEMPEIVTNTVEELKKAALIVEKMNTHGNTEHTDRSLEETIEKLSELENKLEKDISKHSSTLTKEQKNAMSRIDFTAFWSGISDGWNS